jgi:hypothetical protein
MGIPGSANPMLLGGAAVYEIEQSLRFDGSSAYLSRTPSSNTNTNKKGTFSFWIKSTSKTGTNGGTFIGAADTYYYAQFFNQRFYFGNDTSYLDVAGLARDSSAWYHVVYVFDTTLATANDRTKIYVNGSRRTETGTYNTQPSQNSNFKFLNTTQAYYLGRRGGSSVYFDGYMADVHFVDGQALDPEDFGEFDDHGVWRPIGVSGLTYGTNGFYLKFDPSATNGIGHDHSGNGNNFTPSGFTTSGTGTDVMSDTPTTNWCTLNPLDKNSGQLPKDGNLYFDGSVSTGGLDVIAGTMRVSAGKYYWESTITNVGSIAVAGVGITKIQSVGRSAGGSLGGVSGECAYLPSGNKNVDGSSTSYGSSFTTGDTIGVALDCDAGTVTFYKNNTSQGAITYAVGGGLAPAIGQVQGYGAIQTVNFGQRDFAYTPPTGFKALNTANLPAPDIADGSDYFDAVLYTGNGGTQSITGVGFQPDLVWIKGRSFASNNRLSDAVRGVNKSLKSNSTDAEDTSSTYYVTAFDSDGFSLNSGAGDVNQNGDTFVAWNWLAANGTASNTAGSITSTVSANPSAGFSIVTYTGTGANATVGHGLGVAPKMIITKARNAAGWLWGVGHTSIGWDKYLRLQDTTATTTSSSTWQSTAPTSTVFSIGTDGHVNYNSSTTYIAYCFAEVESYSKFGKYTGNGSSDGPFVFLGFKPSFLVIKRSDSTESWLMFDSTRETYNPTDDVLWANLSNAESANYTPQDFLSNGFKIKTSSTSTNASGGTYIFMAFAENPFGGDGVSPATAR